MQILQHGSGNQTTVVFVIRLAVLSGPLKTVKPQTLDPTNVEFVISQLMFNYAEVVLKRLMAQGKCFCMLF